MRRTRSTTATVVNVIRDHRGRALRLDHVGADKWCDRSDRASDRIARHAGLSVLHAQDGRGPSGAVLAGVLIATLVSIWIGLTWWSLGAVIAASLVAAKILRLGEQAVEARSAPC